MMMEHKIKMLTLPRSGGTLIWRIMRFVFKSNVNSDHVLAPAVKNPNVLVFRDIRDCLISYHRAIQKDINSKKAIDSMDTYILHCGNHLIRHINRGCLELRYEEFFSDYNFIFTKIEEHFKIKIKPNLKDKIINETSIEKHKAIQQRFKKWEQYDPVTKIHGRHIYKGEIGGWKKEVPENLHDYFTNKVKLYLVKLRYL